MDVKRENEFPSSRPVNHLHTPMHFDPGYSRQRLPFKFPTRTAALFSPFLAYFRSPLIGSNAMRSGRRRPCLQSPQVLLCLFWFTLFASVRVRADSLSETGASASEWGRIFQNDDVCGLQQWMNTNCQPDRGEGGVVARRASNGRDTSMFTATSCTCTIPYYNIWCGCSLLRNEGTDGVFETWSTDCRQNNISTDRDTTWLSQQGKKIPGWAYTSVNNGTFNFIEIRDDALPSPKWTVIQILVPIIVGVTIVFLSGVIFFYWYHYHLQNSQGDVKLSFSTFFRNLFKRRAPSIVHQNRNDTWVIDIHRDQVVNDSGNDTDSFFRPQPAPLVESPTHEVSPIQVSRWSTTNLSAVSPPDTRSNTGVYSFSPPRNRSSVEQRFFGTSTIRSLGERMRDLLPWVGARPVPINNVRPARGYRIDPGNRSARTNTLSTLSTMRGRGGYETISEVDIEGGDPIGTGRTRGVGGGRHAVRVNTEEEIAAVASSVILIGDQDFTLESGSTGDLQQTRSAQRTRTPGRRAATEDVKSPSLQVSVESPSPTVESAHVRPPPVIPASPGAPPLLPPVPQERPPPPPPTNTRAMPRRTPSPHLRISTQFDGDPPEVLSNNPNEPSNYGVASNQPYSVPRILPSNPQEDHHQDPLIPDSNTGTNALSYATLPGNLHSRSQSSLNSQKPNERRSISGPRPLPSPPKEPPGPVPLAPELTPHKSNHSMATQHVPSGAMTKTFPAGDTLQPVSQQGEFDPYTASGIPRPVHLQPNRHPDAQHQNPYIHDRQRTVSDTSLPRPPGHSAGHLQRGWSADDDMDASLLDHPPMTVDDGMSGSRGVYIAAPRDVATLGAMPSHYRAVSTESFTTVISDPGVGESARNSHRFSSGGLAGEVSPQSPTLSMLQSDPRNRASYVGRRSISGSSGWDVNTQMTHGSPTEPPLPTSRLSPNSSAHPPAALSPQLSPRLGHVRLGSDTSLAQASRSRGDILNPARHDPVRLFPASVRAAGYTTGLGPDSVPIPVSSRSQTPRPSTDANMNPSVSRPGNGHSSSGNNSNARVVSSSGAFSGYVERDRAQVTGGGTWGTESSGVQSIFESVQQLPDVYPHGASSRGFERTS